MNLVNLFNPAHETKVEIALYKLAQSNSVTEIVAPVLVPFVIVIGFGRTLDTQSLLQWLVLLAVSVLTGLITYRVLHPKDEHSEPTASRLQLWRQVNLFSLIGAGVAWGGMGVLYDSVHANQNTALLLTYLAVVTVGGNASGVHSFRMYFITVALSLIIMLMNLSKGFGEQAIPMGMLMTIYPFFVAKISSNAQKTVIRTIELQYLNEQLLKEKAIADQMAERERIYRDLHDDVGAKLLGLAISAQRADLPREADMARSALQDLRDVVSRSVHPATPLGDLLADWREETMQRLDAAGLSMDWSFPEQETEVVISPEVALNLSRILREAVTNVLRHAQASSISFTTQTDTTHFCFSIADDGIGFAADKIKPHRGMTGMQVRAASLNATLDWQAVQPHGCRVRFCVPLASLSPPPDSAALHPGYAASA